LSLSVHFRLVLRVRLQRHESAAIHPGLVFPTSLFLPFSSVSPLLFSPLLPLSSPLLSLLGILMNPGGQTHFTHTYTHTHTHTRTHTHAHAHTHTHTHTD